MVTTCSKAAGQQASDVPEGRESQALISLPLEVQELIYREVLVAPEAIDVCHWHLKENIPINVRHRQENWVGSRRLHGVTCDLLLVCKTTLLIGARIFYGMNMFVFSGRHAYKTDRIWLQTIGPVNRGHLRDLRIDVRDPSRVWQCADGSREAVSDDGFISYDTFHARHPLLQMPTVAHDGKHCSEWVQGMVEDIDPDMEAMFCLLGCLGDTKGSPMRIVMQNVSRSFATGKNTDIWAPFGLDLPNLIEAWREALSTRRDVEVVWMECTTPEWTDSVRKQLDEAGWETTVPVAPDKRANIYCWRKPLTGPIVADLPVEFLNMRRDLEGWAKSGIYGLWLCEEGHAHRKGEECSCAEHDWQEPQTSVAPVQPVWPEMPTS